MIRFLILTLALLAPSTALAVTPFCIDEPDGTPFEDPCYLSYTSGGSGLKPLVVFVFEKSQAWLPPLGNRPPSNAAEGRYCMTYEALPDAVPPIPGITDCVTRPVNVPNQPLNVAQWSIPVRLGRSFDYRFDYIRSDGGSISGTLEFSRWRFIVIPPGDGDFDGTVGFLDLGVLNDNFNETLIQNPPGPPYTDD